MSRPTPNQLVYARALRWAALDLEQHWRSAEGVQEVDEQEPGFKDALKQVIVNLRRQASRIESRS